MFENIVSESNQLIQKGYHQKAFKLLNRLIIDNPPTPMVEEQVQFCRRILYISLKILRKYMKKFGDKAHRIQLMLKRSFEIIHYYHMLLEKILRDSPLSKSGKLADGFTKTTSWIFYHLNQLQIYAEELLLLQYQYYRRSASQQEAVTVLSKLEQIIKIDHPSLRYRSLVATYVANAYFEIGSSLQAFNYYEQGFEISIKALIQLIDDFYQLKPSLPKNLWQEVSHYCSTAIMQLNLMTYCYQMNDDSYKAIETLRFACFLNEILVFTRKCKELSDYIENRLFDASEYHGYDHLEESEIYQIIRLVFPKQYVMKPPQLSLFEETQHFFDEKYKSKTPQLIIKKSHTTTASSNSKIMQSSQTQAYYYKTPPKRMMRSHVKSSSMSTNNSEFNLTVNVNLTKESRLLERSSVQSQSSIRPSLHVSAPKIDLIKDKSQPQSFLTQLLVLENRTLLQDHEFELEAVPKKAQNKQNLTLSLDQQVKKYISKRLDMASDENRLQFRKMEKHVQFQEQIKKELPTTISVLGMQKEMGTLHEAQLEKTEFNKNLEFNVLAYFDYLNANKESAMAAIKNSRQMKNIRKAQQKLITSSNLVIKHNYRRESIPQVQMSRLQLMLKGRNESSNGDPIKSPHQSATTTTVRSPIEQAREGFVYQLQALERQRDQLQEQSILLTKKNRTLKKKPNGGHTQSLDVMPIKPSSDLANSTINQSMQKSTSGVFDMIKLKQMFAKKKQQ